MENVEAGEEKIAESPLLKCLNGLVKPVVDDFGCELVETQFRREAHGFVFRLIIDRENGVGIDDCASISREVAHLLEVNDPIEQAYHLEVSSPGLDRPLKSGRDFSRCLGKKVRMVLKEEQGGENVLIGPIEAVSQESVTIDAEQGVVAVPFDNIKKARLVIEF